MNVEFDWQVENEEGEWETIATVTRRRRHRGMWRVWAALMMVTLILGTGGYIGVRRRYHRALRRIEFQIQSVIDLEALALAQGDTSLFLAQQDSSSPWWVREQAICARSGRLECGPETSGSAGQRSRDALGDGRGTPMPVRVRNVDMRRDVAWVEVAIGSNGLRQARFYRQTNLGWVHTAPRAEFFGQSVELEVGPVTVRAHQRDLPYVEPLVKRVSEAVENLSTVLGIPLDGALTVEFAAQLSPHPLPYLSEGKLVLASPWLSGIPSQGTWDPQYLDQLTEWVARGALSQFMRAAAEGGLDAHQRAILGEHPTFYVRKDLAQALILRPVKERVVDALPEASDSARDLQPVYESIDQWLLVTTPEREFADFEALGDTQGQVIDCAQQKATCQWFLALGRDPRWRARMAQAELSTSTSEGL